MKPLFMAFAITLAEQSLSLLSSSPPFVSTFMKMCSSLSTLSIYSTNTYHRDCESDTLQALGEKTLPRTSWCLGYRDMSMEVMGWLAGQGDSEAQVTREGVPCQVWHNKDILEKVWRKGNLPTVLVGM